MRSEERQFNESLNLGCLFYGASGDQTPLSVNCSIKMAHLKSNKKSEAITMSSTLAVLFARKLASFGLSEVQCLKFWL